VQKSHVLAAEAWNISPAEHPWGKTLVLGLFFTTFQIFSYKNSKAICA
jgi:hypothetical protein